MSGTSQRPIYAAKWLAAVSGLVLFITLAPARAYAINICEEWQIPQDGDEHYVGFGEDPGSGKLALCDYNATDDTWNYYQPGTCTTSTSSSYFLVIVGGYGTDHIFPFTSTHSCNGTDIDAWNSSFSFGLYAYGGGDADEIHGTPNDDYLYSNLDYAYYADTSLDKLCGEAGDDTLTGDADDSSTPPYECEDGGSGSGDTCDAGDAGTTGDRKNNCESTTGGFSATTGACSCTIDIWPF